MEYVINGTYGSCKTPCQIFVKESRATGRTEYCVEGSKMVNITYDALDEGVDIETIQDIDCYTSPEPIINLEDL